MKVRILEIAAVSPTIRRFVLGPVAGELPVVSAGAHVVVRIPGAAHMRRNAYSLTSVPGKRGRYEILVRRVETSHGGSVWLHERAAMGDELEIGLPQNFFPPDKTAKRHLLVSAGIGLTPFLSYAPALLGDFEWHHCAKAADASAFAALLPAGATLHVGRGALAVDDVLAAQRLGTHLYICGPEPFMAAITAAALRAGWPAAKIHTERFGGAQGGAPFAVTLARSGRQIQVRAEETLLEALEAADLAPHWLCRGGVCGQCAVPVMSGVPEHRDQVLDEAARAAGDVIMTCVSRAISAELVLDF